MLGPRAVAPAGVGDDVAVLARQGLDHVENLTAADELLRAGALVEHLVAEVLVVNAGTTVPRPIGIDPRNFVADRSELAWREYAAEHRVPLALQLPAGVRRRRLAREQVAADTAKPNFSPGAVMIAEDFGPVYTRARARARDRKHSGDYG